MKQINPKGTKIKKCTACRKTLNASNWHNSFKFNCTYTCKNCHKQYPSQSLEQSKNNKLKRYGIDIFTYLLIKESQNGKCAICKKSEMTKTKSLVNSTSISLAVDHCHKTGKVRGLLCMKCNRGLGNMLDSHQILKSAIKYLKGEL